MGSTTHNCSGANSFQKPRTTLPTSSSHSTATKSPPGKSPKCSQRAHSAWATRNFSTTQKSLATSKERSSCPSSPKNSPIGPSPPSSASPPCATKSKAPTSSTNSSRQTSQSQTHPPPP